MGSFFDDTGDGKMFLIVPVFIAVIFVLIFGAISFAILRALLRWGRNTVAERITVPALVLAKRGQLRGGSSDTSASTFYFVTFEIEGGERIEFPVAGKVYGTLLERDRGQLSYQGTRYKGFDRTPRDL